MICICIKMIRANVNDLKKTFSIIIVVQVPKLSDSKFVINYQIENEWTQKLLCRWLDR